MFRKVYLASARRSYLRAGVPSCCATLLTTSSSLFLVGFSFFREQNDLAASIESGSGAEPLGSLATALITGMAAMRGRAPLLIGYSNEKECLSEELLVLFDLFF